MKRILVPTDFSPTAEKAFRFALDMAARVKGTVILYHNYVPVENVFVGTEETRKQYNIQNEANMLKRLQRLRKKVLGDVTGVSVSTIVDRSPLVGNLLKFAEYNQVDLVVMGTQGASGLRKTIIGSVAAQVVARSDLPVLLVPAKYELEEPKQFIFATSFLRTEKRALKLVEAMAKLYKADITVLHLLNICNSEAEKEKERADFDTYAFSLQSVFHEPNVQFQLIETTSVSETMETLDIRFPYDVMAMVRRRKNVLQSIFLKNFTKSMAYLTERLLLIVPGEE
jgi:nucleotide-binding universal stress UspA family protein